MDNNNFFQPLAVEKPGGQLARLTGPRKGAGRGRQAGSEPPFASSKNNE
jgi:hypothetical protein